MPPPTISLARRFALIHEMWKPRIVAELNRQHVKLVKVMGEFVWHHHEAEDELFLVWKGRLAIDLRDGRLELGEDELAVIPAGVEHRPVAAEGAQIVLLEPASTINTGNVVGERTVSRPEWL
jgi:mannose-6-phosphate isomerase-like protein (cupin superfamily)